jgi:RHS repeat-associated protein
MFHKKWKCMLSLGVTALVMNLIHAMRAYASTSMIHMNRRWYKYVKFISILTSVAVIGAFLLPGYSDAYAAAKEKEERLNQRYEIEGLRTENSKTYIKGDGMTYVTEQYLEPIHYKKNGQWVDIDNHVQSASGNQALDPELPYVNKDNQFRVGFAEESTANKLVRFQLGDAKVDFRLADGNKAAVNMKDNTVTYPGVYPDTDLVYHVTGEGLKEEWVLQKYDGKSVFTMELDSKGTQPKLQNDGTIQFVDEKGKTEFTVPQPVMVDAKGVASHDVKLDLRTEGNKTYLDLKADESWLKDAKRAYPVVIDPTLTIQGATVTSDTFVSATNPNTNYYLLNFLITGTDPTYGKTRSYIKFQLSPLLSGAQITSAKLYLNQYATTASQQVNLNAVTSDWTSSTVTWNTQPTVGTQLSSVSVGGPGEYNWDLTSLAQGWYNGTTKNYGVSLWNQTETNPQKTFYSSDYKTDTTKRPRLEITYTINPLGQEKFWTTAYSYVNTYNGNFFLPETDVEIKGRGIPAKIDRYYNSQSGTNGLFGFGWTSTMEQHLVDSGNGPIQYTDADGTVHSFTPNGDGTYDTTTVLQLYLAKNPDGTYDLTTGDQSNYHFNSSGKLIEIDDPNGNVVTINYTGSLPTSVTDDSGRQITITYDANNHISKVTDPAGRTVEYGYNANGDLTSVTKKDASGTVLSTVSYGYDAVHHMTSFTDANGKTKTVTYYADYKVNTLSYPITVNGQVQTATVTFSYDPTNKLTTVTDPKGNKTLYTHNDYGNVIQVTQDPTGLNYKQTFTYDNQNELTNYKDANTNAANGSATYNYTYDANGNLTSVTNPLSQTTTNTFDANNNLTSTTDPNSNTTKHEYDKHDNKVSTTDAAQKSSATTYDSYGNVTAETSPMSPGSNLIPNGSFEFDRNGDGWPDGWTKVGPNQSVITWDNSGLYADGVTLGQHSVKITNPTAATAVASSLVPYDPNKTYVMSGYVKTLNAQGNGRLYAFGFDSSGNVTKTITTFGITATQGPTRLHLVLEPGAFPANTATIQLRGYVSGNSQSQYGGTYWFDGMQVEEAFYGAYNLVENGDFERDTDPADGIPDRWYVSNKEASDGFDTTVKNTGAQSWRMNGNASLWKSIYQDINVSGGSGTVLTVSGFSKVQNPNPSGGIYGYIIETYSGSTLQDSFTFNFDKSQSHDWQHIAREIKTTKPFDRVRVYYEYSQQSGTAWFDTAKVIIGSVTTSHTYDTLGNYETSTTDPAGRTTSYTYDTVGNMTSETVGTNTTSNSYDGLDRLTKVTDAKNNVTQYQYDGNDNLTQVTNARNKVTTYQYNELNQIKQVTDPNNQTTTYDYDLNGNQTNITYPNGNKVDFAYNAVNRKTSVSYNGTQRYTFQYDPNSNLTQETDVVSGQSTTYTYDADNKVTSVQETGNQINYTYDNNGNVTQRKYTAGSTTITNDNTYNALNQLTTVKSNGTMVGQFTYTEQEKVASHKNGDSTMMLYKYNGAGDVVEATLYDSNGNIYDDYQYTYDNKGNITTVVSNAGTTSYYYDELNQLIKEVRPDGTTIEYTYDANGNRLTKKVTQGQTVTTTNYTYDDADQLTAVNGTANTYDANGNLTSDGQRTYTYDAENRLTSVKDSLGNTIASFTYYSNGLRKTMTTASGTITFHYDENGNVVYETDQNNNVVASYTYDSENRPVSMTRGGTLYFYQYNAHGDVVALTNASGTVVATYTYDAFGNLLSSTGTVVNPYLYAGYRYDQETGLYYLQSRYYNPNTGRFLTRDTFEGMKDDPLTLNKYVYCSNNPVMNTDPSGHYSSTVVYRISHRTLARITKALFWSVGINPIPAVLIWLGVRAVARTIAWGAWWLAARFGALGGFIAWAIGAVGAFCISWSAKTIAFALIEGRGVKLEIRRTWWGMPYRINFAVD